MTVPGEHFRDVAAAHERCFWLDGGGARTWSRRHSVIGWLDDDDVSLSFDAGTRQVTRHAGSRSEVVGDDIFAALEAEVASGPDDAQWVGYLGYACRTDLPARPSADPAVPDAVWMRTSHVRTFEHDVLPVAPPPPSGTTHAVPGEYADAFDRVQEALRAGLTYELNLTYREAVSSGVDPVTAYLRLRDLNPAPYAGFLQHRGTWLLSSSPERYATIDRHRRIETKPIKGTTRRGDTPAEDEALRERLATDPKFRAENLMIVDLLRNDLAMVCEPGSVEVPVLMDVESYESVHQLVSTVRGHLRAEVSTVGALRSLFPAGSMTGAPKLSTMEITDRVEATARGVYAGAFGWISGDGRADLGVVIRSLVARADGAGWRYELGTGGGITVQSDVEEEWAETRWKAERLLRVFD
jgi:para-aminobenzoate synthetase